MHVEKSLLELSWQQVKKKIFFKKVLFLLLKYESSVCILGNYLFSVNQYWNIFLLFNLQGATNVAIKSWLKIITGKSDLQILLFPQSSCLLPDWDIWDNSWSTKYMYLLKLTMQRFESKSKINFTASVTQMAFLGFGILHKKLCLLSKFLSFCTLLELFLLYFILSALCLSHFSKNIRRKQLMFWQLTLVCTYKRQ